MRVLIVITKGELGGAQTHVLELCRALRRQCDFRVMVGGTGDSWLARELTAIEVPVVNVPGMSNAISIPSLIGSVRQVAANARTWEADLIHVHSAVAGDRSGEWPVFLPGVRSSTRCTASASSPKFP